MFLPGYYLLTILKPDINVFKKIGYSTITSLAIDNLFMFFTYILLYDLTTTNKQPKFYFNTLFLIIGIQVINLILLLIVSIKLHRRKIRKNGLTASKINELNFLEKNKNMSLKKEKGYSKNINYRVVLICILFISSDILMIISVYFSKVPNNSFHVVNEDYRENFTFFCRVPYYFFIFMPIAVSGLLLLIFYSKNRFLILGSISIFLYSLWMLPYIQIGNYFSNDVNWLSKVYKSYLKNGLTANPESSIYLPDLTTRYTSNIFTVIILTDATKLNHHLVLWFIFPAIFIFTPFFLYSIFQDFSINNNKINSFTTLIISVLAILSMPFLKCAHSATTIVLGIYIFFIIVIEFFKLLNNYSRNGFRKKDVFFIIFLYFFLCLTHFEECIYFLIIVFMNIIYFSFIKKNSLKNNIKKFLNNFYLILLILIMIFYFTQEFYAMIFVYYREISKKSSFLQIFLILYLNSDIIIFPILRGSLSFSYIIIILIISFIIIMRFLNYYIIIKFHKTIIKLTNYFLNPFKFIFKIQNYILSKKIFQTITFLCFYFMIILLHYFFYPFLQEQGIFLLVELFLNYTIIVFHLYLFIRGVQYYKINNFKQNYFLICIISTSSIILLLVFTGDQHHIYLAYNIFNVKFLPMLCFFNLIIIQNTYYQDFFKKKKSYILILLFLLISLGVYISLNKIGWE